MQEQQPAKRRNSIWASVTSMLEVIIGVGNPLGSVGDDATVGQIQNQEQHVG